MRSHPKCTRGFGSLWSSLPISGNGFQPPTPLFPGALFPGAPGPVQPLLPPLPCDLCHPPPRAATSSYYTITPLLCRGLVQEGSQSGIHTPGHLGAGLSPLWAGRTKAVSLGLRRGQPVTHPQSRYQVPLHTEVTTPDGSVVHLGWGSRAEGREIDSSSPEMRQTPKG